MSISKNTTTEIVNLDISIGNEQIYGSINSGDSGFSDGSFDIQDRLSAKFGVFNSSNTRISGGEKQLMSAILCDGIESYILSKMKKTKLTEMEKLSVMWVENKDLDYVFSFDVICECLGIGADFLRIGLEELVKQKKISGANWKKIRRPRTKSKVSLASVGDIKKAA